MKLLRTTPSPVPSKFAQTVNDQTDVIYILDLCIRMAEPKTLRMRGHQRGGAVDQLARGGHP